MVLQESFFKNSSQWEMFFQNTNISLSKNFLYNIIFLQDRK